MWLVDFNPGKTQLILFNQSFKFSSDVKMDGSVLEKKLTFKMLRLTFSSKLDWGSYIISIAKTASKKIGALIRSMKFLSPEVALYLYKSTIYPYMEYCCHVWVAAPSCYFELLDKLQKRICRTVGPSLAALTKNSTKTIQNVYKKYTKHLICIRKLYKLKFRLITNGQKIYIIFLHVYKRCTNCTNLVQSSD